MRHNLNHVKIIIMLLVVMTCCRTNSFAQHITVKGGFLVDSIKIGESAPFFMSAHYPSKLTVLFPDSTYGFTPFEYSSKKYFTTSTTDTTSVDSVVYYLTTFETDRVQSLELPAYVVNAQDCTSYFSERDSILITQLVAHVPDSVSTDKLPLRSDTNYQKVFFQFNYFIVLIAVGVLILLAVIVWIFFGKKIIQYYKARRMQKKHTQFMQAFSNIINQLNTSFSRVATEAALVVWKGYMEHLESRPYTKLTTRETLMLEKDETLARNLRAVDTAIYGHNTSVLESLEQLKDIAHQRYQKKLQEVKHGK
jgi:hypothetical protein